MPKKNDQPYMPFYIGDWKKAPEIRAMRLDYRMVWFEMLLLMWQSDEKGYLTINRSPFVTVDSTAGVITKGGHQLASMLGVNYPFLEECFKEFHLLGVYSLREDGAIYSRFMVKLIENKESRALAGKKGMENRYNKWSADGVTNPENAAAVNAAINNNGIHKDSTGPLPPVGMDKVKEIANKVWKDKLWVEQVCPGLSITAAALKKWMAQFNSSVADDSIADFNIARYKRMIRGWIARQQEKGITVETELSKKSDSAPLTRLKP